MLLTPFCYALIFIHSTFGMTTYVTNSDLMLCSTFLIRVKLSSEFYCLILHEAKI
jgi:hypothetical protein